MDDPQERQFITKVKARRAATRVEMTKALRERQKMMGVLLQTVGERIKDREYSAGMRWAKGTRVPRLAEEEVESRIEDITDKPDKDSKE